MNTKVTSQYSNHSQKTTNAKESPYAHLLETLGEYGKLGDYFSARSDTLAINEAGFSLLRKLNNKDNKITDQVIAIGRSNDGRLKAFYHPGNIWDSMAIKNKKQRQLQAKVVDRVSALDNQLDLMSQLLGPDLDKASQKLRAWGYIEHYFSAPTVTEKTPAIVDILLSNSDGINVAKMSDLVDIDLSVF